MSEQSGTPEQPQGPYGPPPPAPSPYGVPPEGQQAVPPPAPAYGQNPYGQPPAYPAYGQAGYGQPGYPMPGYGPRLRDPDARPGTVTAAGIVTIVSSSLALLVMTLFIGFVVFARQSFMQGFSLQSGLRDTNSLYTGVVIAFLVLLVWSVAALVLGILVLRRKSWARIPLVVSSAMTALVSVVFIGAALPAVSLIAAIAVIVLLFTGGAGDWFRHEHAYSQPHQPGV